MLTIAIAVLASIKSTSSISSQYNGKWVTVSRIVSLVNTFLSRMLITVVPAHVGSSSTSSSRRRDCGSGGSRRRRIIVVVVAAVAVAVVAVGLL